MAVWISLSLHVISTFVLYNLRLNTSVHLFETRDFCLNLLEGTVNRVHFVTTSLYSQNLELSSSTESPLPVSSVQNPFVVPNVEGRSSSSNKSPDQTSMTEVEIEASTGVAAPGIQAKAIRTLSCSLMWRTKGSTATTTASHIPHFPHCTPLCAGCQSRLYTFWRGMCVHPIYFIPTKRDLEQKEGRTSERSAFYQNRRGSSLQSSNAYGGRAKKGGST